MDDTFELDAGTGMLLPKNYNQKKLERYWNDPTTKHKTENRVQDHLVGDPEADPLAGLVQQVRSKEGKRPLPPPEQYLSEANRAIRVVVVGDIKRGKTFSEFRVRQIVDAVLYDINDTIYDHFTLNEEAYTFLLDSACCFWKSKLTPA